MATRPNTFESGPQPQEPYGPWAPKIVNKEMITSGPLRSPLKGVLGREVKAPEGKEEYIGQLARRLPEPYLSTALTFLRAVKEDKKEEASMLLLKELKNLNQRIDESEDPRKQLRKCIENVEREINPTIH